MMEIVNQWGHATSSSDKT